MDKLNKLRMRIDWLDEQIASLLNERMMAADQVGRIKKT
nr:chorismate mutase [Parachlamydiaceae bacterium]